MSAAQLHHTPLHALHVELGAKMVPFAGYAMPLHYPGGILAEHRHCRAAASLFDVSHMGQVRITGDKVAASLEALIPGDLAGLAVNHQRYGFFTNNAGGILDDLIVTRRDHDWLVIVNAACKDADLRHLSTNLGHCCHVQLLADQALLALQGPKAVETLARLNPDVARLRFLEGRPVFLAGVDCYVTRSGYTGEDGFEISVPADGATKIVRRLLEQPDVQPAGLGARDTLRLEAGLCLYGHDINETTTPIEAGLGFAIPKVRRPGGARAGHYPGAAAIERQLATGAAVKRVGLLGLERMPVREDAPLVDAHGHKLGHVTSGTLSPTLNKPVAMAYLAANHALASHEVYAEVRGSRQPMRVTPLPFVPHRYQRH